jgi:hypothetical protein
MKNLVLASSIALAFAAFPLAAQAEPIVFDYTGSLVTFTVPTTDRYQILAFGAQGGGHGNAVTPAVEAPKSVAISA